MLKKPNYVKVQLYAAKCTNGAKTEPVDLFEFVPLTTQNGAKTEPLDWFKFAPLSADNRT